MSDYDANTIAYLFDRIPALGNLRGIDRLNAEEIIRTAVADVIDDYRADCEMDIDDYLASFERDEATGGAP